MMRRAASAALTLAVALWPATLPAQEPLELKLKAAFLYNFARLTTWPATGLAEAGTPLEACVLEQDPLVPALQEAFAGKVVEGHPLTVRKLAGASGWEGCHIAYAGAGSAEMLRGLAERGVLTVHEDDAALADGVIRLFVDNRKLRFEVNQAAAERARLRLNARLMALAIVVREP